MTILLWLSSSKENKAMSAEKNEKIGNYWLDEELLKEEFRVSVFHVKAKHLATNWKRCGLTANFWSKYYASDFSHQKMSQKDFQNVASFILNELIENIGKYCDMPESDVAIKVFFHKSGKYVLKVDNLLTSQASDHFKAIAQELFTVDLDELYVQRLEHNLETGEGSGMGYLTMIQDYGVSLGFNFTEAGEQLSRAEISVRMDF